MRSLRSMVLAIGFSLASLPSNSSAIEIGQPAPDFRAKNYEGKEVALAQYKGKTVVLEWFNPDCPFVQKHYKAGHMQQQQRDAAGQGVIWLTINSTAAAHPNYRKPEDGQKLKDELKIASAELLHDADGKVGRLYEAKTTPHLFIIGPDGNVRYDGAIDDQPDMTSDPTTAKNYVKNGLEAIANGEMLKDIWAKPYGCSVKYAGS